MNIAKIADNGQITIPAKVVINNISAQALLNAQKAFDGVAEQMGVFNEDDIQQLVNEVRYNLVS